MQPELEPGRDSEVTAAAADRPENVRMCLGVGAQDLAVRGHDLSGQQIVDGQAVLAHQEPYAAAQREPPDPHRAGVAEPSGQAVGPRRSCVFTGGQTCLGPGGVPFGIDVQPFHVRKIEHYPPFRDTVTGGAVAAAAYSKLQPSLTRERDDVRDLSRVRGPDDDCWMVVDPAVEDGSRLVVPGVFRRDHSTVEGSTELRD